MNHLAASIELEFDRKQCNLESNRSLFPARFDLQRKALTVRSTVDCLIAQTSIDHGCMLLHNDRDYEQIATLRPLKHQRLALQGLM